MDLKFEKVPKSRILASIWDSKHRLWLEFGCWRQNKSICGPFLSKPPSIYPAIFNLWINIYYKTSVDIKVDSIWKVSLDSEF